MSSSEVEYHYAENDTNGCEQLVGCPIIKTYDRWIGYTCIELDCGIRHGILLQDYTTGQLSEEEAEQLVYINTRFRCPTHELRIYTRLVLRQWSIPRDTMFFKPYQLAGRDRTLDFLCPDKDCGLHFKSSEKYRRHVAGILRPWYCLREPCYKDGAPAREGFVSVQEVINHLKDENSIHQKALRYRPVEGWDFRRKTLDEINLQLMSMNLMSEEDVDRCYDQRTVLIPSHP